MGEPDKLAEEARRLAEERAFSIRRFLTLLESGSYTNVDLADLPSSQRSILLPALKALLPACSGMVRLNVGRALLELGDPAGSPALVECLGGSDQNLRGAALDRLRWFKSNGETGGYKVPLDAEAVLAALEPAISSADRWTRERAVHVLDRLATPRAFDRLAELLADARPDVRAAAAVALGGSGQDYGALAVIDEMLQATSDPKRYLLIRALEHLCKSPQDDIRARAAAVASHCVRRILISGDKDIANDVWVANEVWQCLDAVAAAELPAERELLSKVITSQICAWARGIALKRLAQLEGRNGIARLLAALSDVELREQALNGLSDLARGSGDRGVIEALAQEIMRKDAENIADLIKTYLAVGGRAEELLLTAGAHADPDTAMTIHWLLMNVGPREAAAMLRPAFGDATVDEKTIDDLEREWRNAPDATNVVYTLLLEWNRLSVVMCKAIGFPADHEEVIRDLAQNTSGQFALDEVVQTTEANGNLRVLLVYGGIGYSMTFENCGRWCNLDAVLRGLNGILERLGRAEQFIELDTGGDEVTIVLFVHADEFLPVACDLGIRLKTASGSA